MRCRPCQPLPEEVARAADLLGRRWVLAILWAAAEAGAVRFNEFKQTLEGSSRLRACWSGACWTRARRASSTR